MAKSRFKGLREKNFARAKIAAGRDKIEFGF